MVAPRRPGEGDSQWLTDRAHAVMEKNDALGGELIRHLQVLRARRAPAARR